jgi:bifunctional non-homologous end joining protein LigD
MPSRKTARPKHRDDKFNDVRLTSPNKVMYPELGVTKLDLAKYYFQVADWMLPHIQDRPLVLVRCPEGHHKECFYQKHPGAESPANLRRIPVRESASTETYVVADDAAGLISLVQIGALEIHAWGSRADNIERPDRLVFDLDPDPTVAWARVVESAHQIRQFLDALGLQSFVKTTGGKGLHLVVPIQRRREWGEVKQFCKAVADVIVKADPRRYTANMLKSARTGKIYIDYVRNSRGATSIAAYSTRARPGALVSTPLEWRELKPNLSPDQFTVQTIPNRLSSLKSDPWREFDNLRQSLSEAIMRQVQL